MLKPASGDGPRLLVSVRNAEEARSAVEGGADIIDIKEPKNGSLGKADDAAISEVVHAVRCLSPALPISAALGELQDWEDSDSCLPMDADFVKLGLSHCASDWNWLTRWLEVRRPFWANNARFPSWVMVIYADWQLARTPRPQELIRTAAEFSCGAVLLDTFSKDGRSLVDVLSPQELLDIAEAVHRSQLPLAVAGGLRKDDLPCLRSLAPHIVAIRSAACRDGLRDRAVCPVAVREFREHMARTMHLPKSPGLDGL